MSSGKPFLYELVGFVFHDAWLILFGESLKVDTRIFDELANGGIPGGNESIKARYYNIFEVSCYAQSYSDVST